MKLNDLAFSINIEEAQLCHRCAATQGGGVVLGLSEALSQRDSEKRPRKLVAVRVRWSHMQRTQNFEILSCFRC